jgi:hypothetical protein
MRNGFNIMVERLSHVETKSCKVPRAPQSLDARPEDLGNDAAQLISVRYCADLVHS